MSGKTLPLVDDVRFASDEERELWRALTRAPSAKSGLCDACLEELPRVWTFGCPHMARERRERREGRAPRAGEVGAPTRRGSATALPFRARELQACGASFCGECIGRHVESVVGGAFMGVCPAIKCPGGCGCILPSSVWKRFVGKKTAQKVRACAASTLSLQCGVCHNRRTLLEDAYGAESDGAERDGAERDGAVFLAAPPEAAPRGGALAGLWLLAFSRGLCSASAAADALGVLQPLLHPERGSFGWTGERAEALRHHLRMIPDDERRALLALRFYRRSPKVHTPCCPDMSHCFNCKVKPFHEGADCAAFMAKRGGEAFFDLADCPSCGILLAKGDGCDTVTCVCGSRIHWRERVQHRYVRAFAARHERPLEAAVAFGLFHFVEDPAVAHLRPPTPIPPERLRPFHPPATSAGQTPRALSRSADAPSTPRDAAAAGGALSERAVAVRWLEQRRRARNSGGEDQERDLAAAEERGLRSLALALQPALAASPRGLLAFGRALEAASRTLQLRSILAPVLRSFRRTHAALHLADEAERARCAWAAQAALAPAGPAAPADADRMEGLAAAFEAMHGGRAEAAARSALRAVRNGLRRASERRRSAGPAGAADPLEAVGILLPDAGLLARSVVCDEDLGGEVFWRPDALLGRSAGAARAAENTYEALALAFAAQRAPQVRARLQREALGPAAAALARLGGSKRRCAVLCIQSAGETLLPGLLALAPARSAPAPPLEQLCAFALAVPEALLDEGARREALAAMWERLHGAAALKAALETAKALPAFESRGDAAPLLAEAAVRFLGAASAKAVAAGPEISPWDPLGSQAAFQLRRWKEEACRRAAERSEGDLPLWMLRVGGGCSAAALARALAESPAGYAVWRKVFARHPAVQALPPQRRAEMEAGFQVDAFVRVALRTSPAALSNYQSIVESIRAARIRRAAGGRRP